MIVDAALLLHDGVVVEKGHAAGCGRGIASLKEPSLQSSYRDGARRREVEIIGVSGVGEVSLSKSVPALEDKMASER